MLGEESNRFEIKQDGRRRYVVYKVYVNGAHESWFVIRRYREFRTLYKDLRKVYPNAGFKIPPRKIFGNLSNAVIGKRIRDLNAFAQQVLSTPGAVNEESAKLFFNFSDNRNGPKSPPAHPAVEESQNGFRGGREFGKQELRGSYSEKMNPSHFEFLTVVGKGTFGRVYLAKHKETGSYYAVKVLIKNKMLSEKDKKRAMNERNLLVANIQYPFIITIRFCFQTSNKLFLVTDYINGGDLFFHMQKRGMFDEYTAKFYAAEIACAIGHLHSMKIVYRDLKPENILIDQAGHLVLTDLGLAGFIKDYQEEQKGTFCGTPEYFAPEMLTRQPYGFTLDWWCFGTVLYEMLFGAPPFYKRTNSSMFKAIINEEVKIRPCVLVSEEAKSILTRTLEKNPEERLGAKEDFEEIKRHAFFSCFDFDLLEKKQIPPPFIPKTRGVSDTGNVDPDILNSPVPDSLQGRRFSVSVTTAADEDYAGFSYEPPLAVAIS